MSSCLPNIAGIATSTFDLVHNMTFEHLVNRRLQGRKHCLEFSEFEYNATWCIGLFNVFGKVFRCLSPVKDKKSVFF